MWDGESVVKSDFAVLVGLGRLQEPAHVGPASWNRTWSPQWCRDRRRWQSAVRKGFLNGTDVVPIAAPSRCPIEIACNHVNLLRNHDSTDGEDDLLGNTPFLGVDLANFVGTAL